MSNSDSIGFTTIDPVIRVPKGVANYDELSQQL